MVWGFGCSRGFLSDHVYGRSIYVLDTTIVHFDP